MLSHPRSRILPYWTMQWLVRAGAGVVLVCILIFFTYMWPIPYLGFAVNPLTGYVQAVDPAGSADQAGMRVHDRIIRLYGSSWHQFAMASNKLALATPHIPIMVERNGQRVTLDLVQHAPTVTFQAIKLLTLTLAVVCWLTGYICLVRTHQFAGRVIVAVFWLMSSYIIGSYLFAVYNSAYFWFAIQCCVLLLLPLVPYVHILVPIRVVPKKHLVWTQWSVIILWVILSIMVVSLLWFQPSFLHTIQAITDVLPWMIAGSFSASALILTYSYHHTQVAHLRRQIRVIGFAFAWVVLAWLAIISVPTVFNNYHLVANRLIDMTAVGIPLAYLVTIFNRDLYRLDTLIARLTVHATTLITLILMSNLLKHWFHVTSVTALLWQGVYCLILYQPLMRLVMHYVPMIGHPSFDILHAAQTRLTTTLDTQILSTIIVNAVSATFGKPAYAWYDGDSGQTNSLALTHCNRFEVPAHLSAGAFTTHLLSIPAVYESRRLYDDVRDVILDEAEEQTIFHSGIVLWCPIRHKDGFLLGLLLLGMRGDVDPYRIRDQQALSQFLAATALALTNGVTYTQQCKAEQHIRHLYQQLHQVQADTAYQIARRLHDEVLNIYVRLNIEAIQRLLVHYQEGTLHDELTLLLESERGISDELRLICEQLSPTGIHDPFALTTVLRTHVEKMSGLWSGTCTFLVYGQPRPIPSDQQRETLNIVKEALINAIKHAEATQISVTLTYPDDQHASIKIEVSDNGPTVPRIQVKPGHFGLRNMQESSNIINATLTIDASSAGTRVRLWLPIPTDEQASIARSFITV